MDVTLDGLDQTVAGAGGSGIVEGIGALGGAGITLLNAGAGEGLGTYEADAALSLDVPAETYLGSYESTVTQTMIGR
jgi:hypothetical protein